MDLFRVEGGVPLRGEIEPQGAKNEALQVLCAVLLTDQPVTIHNLPRIHDVLRLIELLMLLGVEVEWPNTHTCRLCARKIETSIITDPSYGEISSKLRGSIMLLGPLLAREGKGFVYRPGGDKIGRRRLDTHWRGMMDLGAEMEYDPTSQGYSFHTSGLRGCYMLLDEASVTGTANIIMAAVLAEGRTTIFNAACEPYVQQLCAMLISMGAKISGVASNRIVIDGVSHLNGCEHTLQPDMIEVGSFIGLAALTQGELLIRNAAMADLGPIPMAFARMGVALEMKGDDLLVPRQELYEIETFMDGSIMSISDAPWPGLTPDLLSVFLVVATQARGAVLIHQKMFESRLFFVDKLIDMGAQIILCDPHRATVIGSARSTRLRGTRMTSPDIRAGVALLLAALAAEGESTILNIEQIDRGYERIEERLQKVGARITRFSECLT